MPKNHAQTRMEAYFKLSSEIAHMDNVQLSALFDEGEAHTWWGRHQTISIGRSKVFVKRIPVTNIEYDNLFSTKNFYDLPTYYNYGLGSVGFGVFREIVAQIKTTNWVLAGTITTFPLLYHYRIIPFSGIRAEVDQEQHQRYVEYWGNNANIGRYVLDRANAAYEAVLFLEYIPYTAAAWLVEHPDNIQMVIADMRTTLAFLKSNGILHFDPHLFNILSDGKRAYLTDFGLVLDKRFALTPAEETFYRQNAYYDDGAFLWSLGAHLVRLFQRMSDADKTRLLETFGVRNGIEFEDLMLILVNHLDEINADGMMKLDRRFVANITSYRSIITLMHEFYSALRRNKQKDTRLQHTALRQLIKETGFVAGTVSKS